MAQYEGGIPLRHFVAGQRASSATAATNANELEPLQAVGASADVLTTPDARVPPTSPFAVSQGWIIGLLVLAIVLGAVVLGLTATLLAKSPHAPATGRCTTGQLSRNPPWMFIDDDNCLLTMRFAMYNTLEDGDFEGLVNASMLKQIGEAIERQCNKEIAPNWGVSCEVDYFTAANPPDNWARYVPIVITNENEDNFGGACAYHCEQTEDEFDCNVQTITGRDEITLALGQPWIAAPVAGGEGTDGMLNCAFFDLIVYGKSAEQSIGHTFDHEVIETLLNPHINALYVYQGNGFAVGMETDFFNFTIKEAADPLQFGPGYTLGDTWVWLTGFVVPQYYDGCTSDECTTAPGPYDIQSLINDPAIPFQGTQPFWRYDITSGVIEYCALISPYDDPIEGLYVDCDYWWGPDHIPGGASTEDDDDASSTRKKSGQYPGKLPDHPLRNHTQHLTTTSSSSRTTTTGKPPKHSAAAATTTTAAAASTTGDSDSSSSSSGDGGDGDDGDDDAGDSTTGSTTTTTAARASTTTSGGGGAAAPEKHATTTTTTTTTTGSKRHRA
jgi:hypothetical protein